MSVIGEPLTRIDGRIKVTGTVQYTADVQIPNLAHAVMVQSTIPNGRIAGIDATRAEAVAGVIAVLTCENSPKPPAPEGRLSLLQDDLVHYNGQPIALVVAESLVAASHAASLICVQYEPLTPKLNFKAGFPASYPWHHVDEPGDLSWGDITSALEHAEVKVEQVYTTPIQHHNPMEPHATIAQWEGCHLILHDTTQNITGVKKALAKTFGLPDDNVRVISCLIGGGFGCKGSVWSHVVLAAMAAKHVKRPVKLVLERPQMFGPVGARPQTYQQIALGATRSGKLTAIRHEVHAHTSVLENYLESSATATRVMYACPNVSTKHRLVPLNLGTPTYTRAPGVATGTYALEVAMDELAYRLNMDPLQLRLLNYAAIDPHTRKAFTGKHLRECYLRGAERFGWSRRSHEPRSMHNGSQLIGWGMATETYPARRLPAEALVRLQPDGRVLVASGTHELGTGTYTILTQVAADYLNMPPELIDVKLGDTNLPEAPISAGSMTVASVTPAVQAAAVQARLKLFMLAAQDPQSPAHGLSTDEIGFKSGRIFRKSSPQRSESYTALLARHGEQPIQAIARAVPDRNAGQFSAYSFGAVFAEVSADLDLGIVRVPRIVAVYDIGRLLNEKTGKSQLIGGIVWGISLALEEDMHLDARYGRFVNANLAGYLVPVNADIGEIDVSVTGIPDMNLDPFGARGIGEIGITGTGAAIANAIYHATGKRVRELPITPDKLLV